MAINFPTSLDSFLKPQGSDKQGTLDHALQHTNANLAIEALETKVGVNNSAVATTLDYLMKSTSSVDPGHKHSPTSINGLDIGVDVQAYDSTLDTWATKTPPTGTVLGDADSQSVQNKSFDNTSPTAFNPPGSITMYAGAVAPTGWLLCQGQSLLRADYPALFAAIGTAYGAADGTHFSLPNLQDKFPIGASGTKALASGGGAAAINLQHAHTVLAHSHSMSHTHTSPNGGEHSHSTGGGISAPGADWVYNLASSSGPYYHYHNTTANGDHNHGTTNSQSTSTTGGVGDVSTTNQLSTTQSVLNPYLAINYIIKI